jgi:hypothetical protein
MNFGENIVFLFCGTDTMFYKFFCYAIRRKNFDDSHKHEQSIAGSVWLILFMGSNQNAYYCSRRLNIYTNICTMLNSL